MVFLSSAARRLLKFAFLLIVALAVLATVLFAWAWALVPKQQSFDSRGLPADVKTLSQGWNSDIRQQVNFTPFGSLMVPYGVFINIERAESETRLADTEVLAALGFIPATPESNNPDGLPVGFAIDLDHQGKRWVGLTCAACHMGQVTHKGTTMFIDGGPGMIDFTGFEREVRDALAKTLASTDKYERLKSAMEKQGYAVDTLAEQLQERLAFMENRLTINAVDVPYGYGRVDAFGQIFNAVTATALNKPDNALPPNAPVSIPVLWGAPHLDLVQWNGSAPNANPGPLGQNVTTALAVYGEVDIKRSVFGYHSSVDIANLGYIQHQLYKLKSPLWQENILGAIDASKRDRGEDIYREQCVQCHEISDRNDETRQLRASVIPLEEIQTDPQMADNFVEYFAGTGVLDGTPQFLLAGQPFQSEARMFDIVLNAAIGTMLRSPVETLSSFLYERAPVPSASANFNSKAYKARPLNGIWASGPYLHNGSVPTVWDLLQPVAERPSQFYVGGREVDAVKLGLQTSQAAHSSLFDTRLQGNRNTGHEHGVALSVDDKWALIEYLKTL